MSLVTAGNKKAQQTQGLRAVTLRAFIPRWPSAAILDTIEPQIVPFDQPTRKPQPRIKHGVDQMHRLRDICL